MSKTQQPGFNTDLADKLLGDLMDRLDTMSDREIEQMLINQAAINAMSGLVCPDCGRSVVYLWDKEKMGERHLWCRPTDKAIAEFKRKQLTRRESATMIPGRWYEVRTSPDGQIREIVLLPDDYNEPMPPGAYRVQRSIYPGLRSRQ